MVEVRREDISDKYSWWCRGCKTRKSVRHGSFFARSKLELEKLILMMYLWSRECPVGDAAEQAGISERVAIDIYQWLREICTEKLLQAPIVLGGAGTIVQIDESLYRHKPKVCTRTMVDFFNLFIIYIKNKINNF